MQPLPAETSQHDSSSIVPHLRAFGCALGAALLLMGVLRIEAQRYLRNDLESFATGVSPLKMNGNLLQRAAFSNAGVLPIYGSSELDQPADNRPDVFFARRPTGFSAFAEGHAGTTCLMIMQKIAAVGRVACGKKMAIFLSPSWFARPEAALHTGGANLPNAQVNAWVFDSPLDRDLKHKLAIRLLRYPEATEGQPLLRAAVRSLARRTGKDRLLFDILWPLGETQYQMSIGFESGTLWWDAHRHSDKFRRDVGLRGPAGKAEPPSAELNWDRLAAKAESAERARDEGTPYSVTSRDLSGPHRDGQIHPQGPGSRDAEFGRKLRAAEEWHDLKLLTEVLRDLKVHALFISQPINGKFYDLDGISSVARKAYYSKLNHLIQPAGFPLSDFAGYENDRFFFNDSGHPSAKAWVYYDRELDRFYHDRLP